MNGDPPAEVRFGLLGPVLASSGGSAAAVRAARQRTLLAALLLRANRVVAADELADQVWDGAPPAGAAATLPSYVLRLRRALGPVAGGRLQTRSPGYLIEVRDDSELDLRLFAALRRRAHDAAAGQDWSGAAVGWRAALGRPAEALAEYARLRRVLVGDLGVEPGPPIEALQAAILDGQALPPLPTSGPPNRPASGRRATLSRRVRRRASCRGRSGTSRAGRPSCGR